MAMGVYVNSFIVDEGVPIEKISYDNEGCFISNQLH
jgi:hypothetical protein